MTVSFYDSENPPTLAQAQIAKSRGVVGWGLYISGSAAARIWTVPQIAVLRAAGLAPLPVCVPNQAESENPIDVASLAIGSCQVAGILSGAIVLDLEHSANTAREPAFWDSWYSVVARAGFCPVPYNGPHLPFPMPRWDPLPHSQQPNPAPGQAIQWTGGSVAGLSVDVNIADNAFPFGSWSPPPPPPPPFPPTPPVSKAPQGDQDMIYTVTQYGQDHVFSVTPSGDFVHDYWTPSPAGWGHQVLFKNCDPTKGVTGWNPATKTNPGQMDVFAMTANGERVHCWYAGTSWGSELFSTPL